MPRNDIRQYDVLAEEWTRSDGPFAALHWLAVVRGQLVPPPPRGDAVLLDVGCGGGLLAPYVAGYRHVGVDLSPSACAVAAHHGVPVVRADVRRLPCATGSVDVVVAGEILEHVHDPEGVVAEMVRVLGPHGVAVFDTINSTWFARLSYITLGERLPGGPPPNIHDPALFVAPERVRRAFEAHGMSVAMRGLRPSLLDYLRFLADRRRSVRMLPTRSLAGVYQGVATRTAA